MLLFEVNSSLGFTSVPGQVESYAIAFGPIIIGFILILLPIVFN